MAERGKSVGSKKIKKKSVGSKVPQPAIAGKEREEEDPNQAERRAGPLDLREGDQGSPGGAQPLRGLRPSGEL